MRGKDRDYANDVRIDDFRPSSRANQGVPAPPLKRQHKRKSRKPLVIGICAFLIILIAGVGGFLYINKTKSPVPKNISKSVNFPIYYPDQKKLPSGYTLSKSSFKSPQPGAVLYSVQYDNGKKLVFSVQQKPSDSDLAAFVKNYIPIHRQVLTLVGTATVGAIGPQTVVSLPTDSNTWIIVTGPANAYGTDNLAQVLKALKK
jgi:hypothetical protein